MITVGIPTYNRAHYLQDAITAILTQTFSDFELIICDDGSQDDTRDVVARFEDDRIRYLRQDVNSGIPAVLNTILRASRGDAIVMLHDHDVFHGHLLDSLVQVLDKHPSVGFVNPGLAWMDPNGGGYAEMTPLPPVSPGSDLVASVLSGDSFSCPISACSLVRRSAYEAVGGEYDERFGFLSDVDMWLRLALRYDVGQAAAVGLICRRREADHEFGNGDWRLVRWLLAIHRVNIERYYASDPQALTRATEHLQRKAIRLTGRNLLATATRGDRSSLQEGLSLLETEMSGTPSMIARAVGHSATAQRTLLASASVATAVRSRLRPPSPSRHRHPKI